MGLVGFMNAAIDDFASESTSRCFCHQNHANDDFYRYQIV